MEESVPEIVASGCLSDTWNLFWGLVMLYDTLLLYHGP